MLFYFRSGDFKYCGSSDGATKKVIQTMKGLSKYYFLYVHTYSFEPKLDLVALTFSHRSAWELFECWSSFVASTKCCIDQLQ